LPRQTVWRGRVALYWFLRDEGQRYDAEAADAVWQEVDLYRRAFA
jgi:hypothetical protein